MTFTGTPRFPDDKIALKVIDSVNAGSLRNKHIKDNKNVSVGEVLKNPSIANSKRLKITHTLLGEAYSTLRNLVRDKNVDANNIAIIAAYALQISNEMLTTNKSYKIELTMIILRKLIDEEITNNDQKIILNMALESIVPSLMTTIDGLPNLLSRIFKKIKSCIRKK